MPGLRGLVGQAMTGHKVMPVGTFVASYPAGSWTFVAPVGGVFKFVGWGGGAGGSSSIGLGGSSGAYVEKTRRLASGDRVSITVAAGGSGQQAGNDTSFSFADGLTVTAGGATSVVTSNLGGIASNGDLNLNGSNGSAAFANGLAGAGSGGGAAGVGNGSTIGGAAGAPGVAPFFGGLGGGVGVSFVNRGAGGAGAGGAADHGSPGDLLVVMTAD